MTRFFALLFLLLAPFPLLAANSTNATLVSETTSITPAQPFRVALILEPPPGWHTYWENPGDAGMATSLTWTLPPGFTAAPIDWPTPTLLKEGPLVTFAYPGRVFLPVTITPPQTPDAATQIRVKAQWLVCKDICVPESAELSLDFPLAQSNAALFAEHDAARPKPAGASYAFDDKQLTLQLPTTSIQSAGFLPRQSNLIRYDANPIIHNNSITFERSGDQPEGPISGLLLLTSSNGETSTLDLTARPGASAAEPFLPALLLSALLGGLILNLMPCVLPVLSLKALALAKKSAAEPRDAIRRSIAYTLGILTCFALLAGILIALRETGATLGWGFQMQSPPFVGFLAYLLFAVGLSLAGLFELPILLGGANARSSFATGMLAALVATPCTAPFMAAAIGAALTLPALEALLIFEALGLGLALPFLLIGFCPRLLRFLPKPGAWMLTFRQLLAFPMLASSIWLVWVLGLQTGINGAALVLCGMLAIAFIIWLRRFIPRILLLALTILTLALTLPLLTPPAPMDATPYSSTKLSELRAAHTPVFVDATAAWCITCQINRRLAIENPRVQAAFAQRHITLLVADWTSRDDAITGYLAQFGHKGVPLYVYYPPSGEPRTLPQLLTPDIILTTINGD